VSSALSMLKAKAKEVSLNIEDDNKEFHAKQQWFSLRYSMSILSYVENALMVRPGVDKWTTSQHQEASMNMFNLASECVNHYVSKHNQKLANSEIRQLGKAYVEIISNFWKRNNGCELPTIEYCTKYMENLLAATNQNFKDAIFIEQNQSEQEFNRFLSQTVMSASILNAFPSSMSKKETYEALDTLITSIYKAEEHLNNFIETELDASKGFTDSISEDMRVSLKTSLLNICESLMVTAIHRKMPDIKETRSDFRTGVFMVQQNLENKILPDFNDTFKVQGSENLDNNDMGF